MNKFFSENIWLKDGEKNSDKKKEEISPAEKTTDCEKTKDSISDNKINEFSDNKKVEYKHWQSELESENNKNKVENYDKKIKNVEKIYLETQSFTLKEHYDSFDSKNVERMKSEFESNKIEIYNEPYFLTDVLKGVDPRTRESVIGCRDTNDGKICIRDSKDINRLKHTITHETIHDLSYQKVSEMKNSTQSGIYAHSRAFDMSSGALKVRESDEGRGLNEGLTEMYTERKMQKFGEELTFAPYSQELSWAANIEDIVGVDICSNAYFGGDIDSMKEKVNDINQDSRTWDDLIKNIDEYHFCRGVGEKASMRKYKDNVDRIVDNLHSKNADKGGN